MDVSEIMRFCFMCVYTATLVTVCVYGFHRWALVCLYYRHRRKAPMPFGRFDDLPTVTVQLPMYNERFVARRIIERTCELDYPRDRLQVQVLDDSTDDTCRIAQEAVQRARAAGFDIEYIHRDDRTGYKAGALANGMKAATGEFISIFDADFLPPRDFLRRSIQHFTDPRVCVVQTRWDHLNRDDSLLTRSQAILLDGHFAIEHVARNRSARFMNFNGTAGTWRRAAIEDAGGWHHDTLTEDLDLSYRAQLKGWKFVFLPELTSPAELPPEMLAFKAQQFRWTKGGAQTALKLLPTVLRSGAPLKVKVESFFHLTAFTLHLFMLALVVMLYPALWLRAGPWEGHVVLRGMFDLGVFALATLSAGAFYVAAEVELTGNWRMPLKYLPMMMALGVGLCLSNAKAILEAWFGRPSEFVRTQKYGGKRLDRLAPATGALRGRSKRHLLPYLEFAFGVYMACCAVSSILNPKLVLASPFLVLFAFGFFYVSVTSFQAEQIRRRVAEHAVAEEA